MIKIDQGPLVCDDVDNPFTTIDYDDEMSVITVIDNHNEHPDAFMTITPGEVMLYNNHPEEYGGGGIIMSYEMFSSIVSAYLQVPTMVPSKENHYE